ncbi:hypothetical protein, partial [Limosilactobacillus fermentum]
WQLKKAQVKLDQLKGAVIEQGNALRRGSRKLNNKSKKRRLSRATPSANCGNFPACAPYSRGRAGPS